MIRIFDLLRALFVVNLVDQSRLLDVKNLKDVTFCTVKLRLAPLTVDLLERLLGELEDPGSLLVRLDRLFEQNWSEKGDLLLAD